MQQRYTAPMEPNAIQTWLEAGGIAWRRPIAWFVERFGIETCRWLDLPVILVRDAARILPGLLRPPAFQMHRPWARTMPPAHFSAAVHISRDWAENLATVHAALAGPLGAPARYDTDNTRGWRWTDGAAELTAISFPPALQPPFQNMMYEADPRTRVACSVSIVTGFRAECTAEEQAALAGFSPVAPLPGARLERLRGSQYELEYLRARPNGLDLPVGLGRATGMIVAAADDLYLVPAAEARALRLGRARPARGGGYSQAQLRCLSAAAGGAEKDLPLIRNGATDGLDSWAREAARALGLPLEIEEYDDD